MPKRERDSELPQKPRRPAIPCLKLSINTDTSNRQTDLRPVEPDDVIDYDDDRRVRLGKLLPVASEILPYLFMGGAKAVEDRNKLLGMGITLIVNAAAVDIGCPYESDFEYLPLYLSDTPDEDIQSVFPAIIQSIDNVRASGGKVFVHCHQGVSRSATLVIAYLMWKQGRCFSDALQYTKVRRSIVSPNAGFLVQLMWWGRRLAAPPKSEVWVYLPFSKQYPLPFIFRPVIPKDGGVVLDDRMCYGVVQQDASDVLSISLFGGKCCSDEVKKDAALLLHHTRNTAFYTQAKEAKSTDQHGTVITFKPVRFTGDVNDISNDPKAIDTFRSALGVPVTFGHSPLLDDLLPDSVSLDSSMVALAVMDGLRSEMIGL